MTSTEVIGLVDSRRQHSLRYNQRLFDSIPGWYKLYRGVWEGRLAQFRNNVSVPFLFAMVQSDVARKVQMLLSGTPIVEFEGYAPEDQGRAKKNSVLISAQMRDCQIALKSLDFFLSADLCGTGVGRYGWKNLTRKHSYRKLEHIAPGLSIPVEYNGEFEFFNGPDFEVIDRLDFWNCPGYKDIDQMPWAIHRYWRDLDDLTEDANNPYPYFDPNAVKLLEQAPMGTVGAQEYTMRRTSWRNPMDYQARQSEKFAKPVEIWEMHGLVPSEFAPDGIRNRCIAVGNGRVVLKNRASQMPNGRKPFVSYSPMPDPYTFDPPGKVEIVAPLQRTINRLSNQKLDALDLVIDPQYVVSSKANLNTQHLFTRAGRIILVDDVTDDSNFRPLTPNLQGLQQAYSEVGQLWQFMQLGAGINDIIMGLQPGDRETARGFLGRQENVMTRLSMESWVAEMQYLEPLGDAFRDLDRVFLSLPHEVKILGSLSMVNPITGLPYPQERVSIDFDDLVPDYRCRAVGASQMMGRSVRQQNLIALQQVVQSNPAMAQIVNWANFARQAFELFDFKNIDELIVQQIPLINQLASDNGMAPTAMANQLSQPLQSMEPAILGALGNNQLAGRLSPTPQAA